MNAYSLAILLSDQQMAFNLIQSRKVLFKYHWPVVESQTYIDIDCHLLSRMNAYSLAILLSDQQMAFNLIQSRKVLYAGTGDVPDYRDGTKVSFHFRTVKVAADGAEELVIDDTRKCGKPMELIIGKKFKLILWEEWIKSMRVREVSRLVADRVLCTDYPFVSKLSRLVADRVLCTDYPFVSKCYRQFSTKTNGSTGDEEPPPARHCCGMAMKTGLGHEDLDKLVTNPSDLEFTIELLSVESPEDYDKEIWQMNAEEMVNALPIYRRDGNRLYADREYEKAGQLYGKALAIVEQLLLREKPGDEDWARLDAMKVPFLSNLSQCRLIAGDYYQVIEFTTECLQRDPNNTKALFRRAKAHVRVWNSTEARRDFELVSTLDPTLAKAVQKELQALDASEKSSDRKDSQLLRGKLFS
ncbi:unnamed protein product [Medioppia subpectinata]|uniref:AIP/AIPL N-terminal FKBP-type PPIase domain-containing protein n=1 Tax=Medioppia subpectinata TaxID=1979941 RepID=A0A7R9KQ51_9ACAR|nr:unnamed protein product [Medioppia subpectinata]CAG2107339.1 unnamed protein product [Medioppia subpectinata]